VEIIRKILPGTHTCPRCLADGECWVDGYYPKGHAGMPRHFCRKCGASWETDFFTGEVKVEGLGCLPTA